MQAQVDAGQAPQAPEVPLGAGDVHHRQATPVIQPGQIAGHPQGQPTRAGLEVQHLPRLDAQGLTRALGEEQGVVGQGPKALALALAIVGRPGQ